jgi:very-short-patch-repair endonuclease
VVRPPRRHDRLCRLVFAGLGLAQPEQQVDIRDERGRFVARVDFLIRERRLVIEFDGATKYAGPDGRAALMAEKRREDELRRLGYRVVRLTWADLFDPARLVALLGL